MTTVTLFTDSVDMTQWGGFLSDLNSTIGGAGMTTHTATKIVLNGALEKYTLTGTFGYNSSGAPHGTIASLAIDDTGGAHYAAITGLSLKVADLETFGAASDGAGFERTVFRGADTFAVGGGVETLNTYAGNDTINMASTLTAADSIDGGAGNDTVILSGNYANLVLGATTLVDVEKIQLTAGTSYRITTNDGNVASGKVMEIDCSGAGFGYALNFDGRAEKNGSFIVKGGNGNDTIFGGNKNDTIDGAQGHNTIIGGNGADTLTVASGNDTLVYTSAAQSTRARFDHIVSFDFSANDHFNLGVAVTGVDSQVSSVALHTATFDSDMATALGATQLHAGHAVLVTAGVGDYTGDTFLVVEHGGGAGYQAGKDFVFLLDSSLHIANLDTSDFVF